MNRCSLFVQDKDRSETPADTAEPKGNHLPGMSRICGTTGFTVDLTAQKFIQLNAVAAVINASR